VPFFLSGVLIGVGLLIRMRITETPLFAALKANNEVAAEPVSETIRLHWRYCCSSPAHASPKTPASTCSQSPPSFMAEMCYT